MSSSLITYAVKNIAPTLFVHSTEWFLDYSFTDAVSIVSSPVTSYADQIWSIHKSGTSRGFSLDIPLIMLTASILKVFYWLSAHFTLSLLLQSLLMICVQSFLLHVALQNRPLPSQAEVNHKPFAGSQTSESPTSASTNPFAAPRPYGFWQWRQSSKYWHFLLSFTSILAILQVLIGRVALYGIMQGYVALAIEAVLPIPQIVKNHQAKGCKGFRLSVLVNWLLGDAFKLWFFFVSGSGEGGVPWAFKLCGLFQAACDLLLGAQYFWYGQGPSEELDMGKKEDRDKERSIGTEGIPVPLTDVVNEKR